MIIGKKIEIFIAVVEAGSFSASTKQLSISQSVVSFHIDALENEMGLKLIERKGRTIELTPEGKLLYQKGKRLLRDAQKLEGLLAEKSDKIAHRINFGGDALTCAYTLPWNVAAFREKNPGVVISYDHLPTDEALQRLLNEELDLALMGHAVRHKKLDMKKCFDDEIILVGSASRSPDKISVADLPGLPLLWINNDKGLAMVISQELAKAGMPLKNLNVIMEIEYLPILKSFIRAGVACAFLPKVSVEDELRFGLLKHVEIEDLKLARTTYLVHRKLKNDKEIVSRFIEFFQGRPWSENKAHLIKLTTPIQIETNSV
jgi:DNA-binding transcriptional LysR family regulator